jgi:hypothetical protein
LHWLPQTRLIWHPQHVTVHYEQPKNACCLFRKTFDLPPGQCSPRGEWKLFADSRYMLFVNGQYVARGPGRSDPRRQSVDSHDISRFLRHGTNSIGVLALHYGYGTGQYIHRIPALVGEGAIRFGDNGESITICTDESWKCRLGDAYDELAPRVNGCQGAMEVADAGNFLPGWTSAAFRDDDWTLAKGRSPRLSPFWNWVPREIPLLEEGQRDAQAVVNRGTLTERPEPVHRLHMQLLAEEDGLRIEDERRTEATEVIVEPCAFNTAAFLTYDFDLIDAGYLQLEVSGPKGAVLDAVYAEELYEGKVWLDLNKNRSADRFILSGGNDRFEIAFGWKAFRYVQVRVRSPQGAVRLHRVGMRTRKYALDQTGRFASSEPLLDRIWTISARTLRLCMQDGFLDSSSREQQQWMGDARVQAVINAYYSGDARLHRKLLCEFGQSQDWMGMTAQRYPDGHHNYPPIPSFCLAWVCSFADYQQYSGDRTLLGTWWNHLIAAMRWFTAWENERGLLEDVPYWSFIDWAEGPAGRKLDVQRQGIVTTLNLQYLEAIRCMIAYAGHMRDEEAERVYGGKLERLATSIATELWDERKFAYPDCKVKGVFSETISEPTNALALLHLHTPDSERAELLCRHVFAPEAEANVVKGSPFFMLTVFRALIRHGRARRALEMTLHRYGAMIEAGATTVWEKWKLFYRLDGKLHYGSASHGWGAAPIVLAVEGIFGVEALEEGFASFQLQPGDLLGLERAAASFATSKGFVHAEAERLQENRMRLSVTVPAGGRAIVYGRELGPGEHELEYELPN